MAEKNRIEIEDMDEIEEEQARKRSVDMDGREVGE